MAAIHTVQPGWFSLRGAAIYTGFSVTALRTAMKLGKFPVRRVPISGSGAKDTARIKREHLDAWIESSPFEPCDSTEGNPMFGAVGNSPLESATPAGMRAVFIREEDFQKIQRAGEMVELKDPP